MRTDLAPVGLTAVSWTILSLATLLLPAGLEAQERDSREPESVQPTARPSGVSESTQQMIEQLSRLLKDELHQPSVGGVLRAELLSRQVTRATGSRRLLIRGERTKQLLYSGSPGKALEELFVLRVDMRRARVPAYAMRSVNKLIVVSHLRVGENANCLARHGRDSCLFPIRGDGVHTARDGSTGAITELMNLLATHPGDLANRWLINFAYMTLGGYPDQVPPQHLIDPAAFSSTRDIGRFPNVATELGADVLGLSGGAILEDLNGDGSLDIMVSGWGLREQLRFLPSDGNGRFVDATEQAGIQGLTGGLNLVHADYDNDGDRDVLVLRGGWLGEHGRHPNSLLRNDGQGHFEDVTFEAGLFSWHPTQTAVWMDFNNDGWLDLFIGNESQEGSQHPCQLYLNSGGRFTDIAPRIGLDHVGFVKGVACGDYDNDGRPDLYLSRQGQSNVLLHNETEEEGGVKFVDVTATAGVGAPSKSFATWFWDPDNDGWLDLFVAPFPGFGGDNLGDIAAGYLGQATNGPKPRMFHNNRDGSFTDVTSNMGLDTAMLVMGANFGDFDNDGYPDLYFGTGEPSLQSLVPNRAYRNDRGQRFENVTFSGGFGHLQKGHGVAFGDIDQDGDQDVLVVQGGAQEADVAYNALFRNPGHGNKWLTLRLRGDQSNRDGIGARIRARVIEGETTRDVHVVVGTGGSFGCNSLEANIGLGTAQRIQEVEIRWPAGTTQLFKGLVPEHCYEIRENAPEPLEVNRPKR